jgi:hypothetical protein
MDIGSWHHSDLPACLPSERCGGKADLGLIALASPIYEYSLASRAFTLCTALTPTPCALAVEMMPNPAAQVLCPACGETYLAVQDTQPFGEKKERILSCVKCGAREFILMGA